MNTSVPNDTRTICAELHRNAESGIYSFICSYCGDKISAAEKEIKKHLETHHSKITRNSNHLKMTYKQQQPLTLSSTPVNSIDDFQPPNSSFTYKFIKIEEKLNNKCENNSDDLNIITQIKIEPPLDCDNCYNIENNIDSKQTVKSKNLNVKKFSTLPTVKGLQIHELTQFKCDKCLKCFVSQTDLTQHQKLHLNLDEYKCEVCNKSFNNEKSMKNHKHSNSKVECDMCGKLFGRKDYLIEHFKRHANLRSYICTICKAGFNTNSALKIHRQTHNNNEESLPPCMRPVECNVCHKMFKTKASLKNHYYAHTGQYDLRCEVCNMGFNKSYRLKRHMLCHDKTRERLFQCPICPKSYHRVEHVNEHVKKVHTEDKFE